MSDRIAGVRHTICDYCEKLIEEESFYEKINGKEMQLCDICYYGCSWSLPVSANTQKN